MLIRFVSSIYGCATYASNRMDLRAYTEMIKSVLRLILYVLIFTVFKPSIVYVGIVLFLLELFNSITQIYLARKLLPNMYIRRSFCNVKLIADTLKVGVWNSLNQLGDLLLSSSDLIMSNVLLGESASGSISIVKTMPTLISGVITAVNGVFMPRISHRYGENNKEALIKEVQMSQKIMGAMVTPIIILLIVFGYDFFDLWVPGNDTKLLMQLSALDVSRMLIIGVAWPVSNLNIVLDKVKIPSLIVLASGGLNIISMIILTKHTSMGIYAILLTTLFIAVLFYGLIIPIYPCRLLEISVLSFYKPIFQMFLASGLIFVCIFPLHRLFEITNWFDFFVCGGLCSIIAYLISLLIFIGPKQAYAKIRRQ